MFDKELVQFNIKCLTTYTMTKRRTNNSLFNLELVEMGTNDLLKEQSFMNLLVSPNFTQSNDVSINLITSVNFFKISFHFFHSRFRYTFCLNKMKQ